MAPSSLSMFYSTVAFFVFLPAEAPLTTAVKLLLLFPNGGEQVAVGSLLSELPFFDDFIIMKSERLHFQTEQTSTDLTFYFLNVDPVAACFLAGSQRKLPRKLQSYGIRGNLIDLVLRGN